MRLFPPFDPYIAGRFVALAHSVHWVMHNQSTPRREPGMKEQIIIMTRPDYARLTRIIEEQHNRIPSTDRTAFKNLKRKLACAKRVAEHDIPPDVVTMNSEVLVFEQELGSDNSFTLSWPDEAGISQTRINVFTPLGTALLGSRVGQEIEWPLPDRICRLRVEAVLFQPENNSACETC
ncbi:transcription elongation factor GreAB [Verrucomicrobia bacterium S94]|nr:transcription elongation factor GreAB [Verrucomicrobia bacterium S94]